MDEEGRREGEAYAAKADALHVEGVGEGAVPGRRRADAGGEGRGGGRREGRIRAAAGAWGVAVCAANEGDWGRGGEVRRVVWTGDGGWLCVQWRIQIPRPSALRSPAATTTHAPCSPFPPETAPPSPLLSTVPGTRSASSNAMSG